MGFMRRGKLTSAARAAVVAPFILDCLHVLVHTYLSSTVGKLLYLLVVPVRLAPSASPKTPSHVQTPRARLQSGRPLAFFLACMYGRSPRRTTEPVIRARTPRDGRWFAPSSLFLDGAAAVQPGRHEPFIPLTRPPATPGFPYARTKYCNTASA
ncbi:hypothetical protein VFPFJ_07041 [Purpureocillium lilacinum]|uniref:Uncharacterized protein n=1 Tax=Purpureocillium lilacinum TaxID=33203 RepID=A0A179HDW7_PURLI|nr:hypothetical protein VFPFJ_07041 [Purpureocillium lilacinum]OAQ88576.1 hypothetical protein VFPFJ_07041 [Purpureocillium lilacinum]